MFIAMTLPTTTGQLSFSTDLNASIIWETVTGWSTYSRWTKTSQADIKATPITILSKMSVAQPTGPVNLSRNLLHQLLLRFIKTSEMPVLQPPRLASQLTITQSVTSIGDSSPSTFSDAGAALQYPDSESEQ